MKKSDVLWIIAIVLIAFGIMYYRAMTPITTIPTPGSHSGEVIKMPIIQTVQLSGVGTEPFRAFRLSGDTLIWDSPEWSGSFNGIVYQGISGSSMVFANPSLGIQIITTSGICSDGMSTIVYPGKVEITLSGNTYNGCVK